MQSPYAEDDLLGAESLAARAVRRRTGARFATAEDEVRRLLDAGLVLMRADAAGNPKIAEIVRLAKVSNDAFYRAFRSKDDLVAAIADDGARRLLGHLRHQCGKQTDPIEQVRACVQAVFKQAADPEVAATTRAVLRNTSRGAGSASSGIELRQRIAELLTTPLTACGSRDPARDALAASCAMFAVMEQFLWAERVPTAADVEHLIGWILPAAPDILRSE
ncbi:TetR/AcrR family transcriptional regulator [Nocardia sp. NBC_00565]|uniref:TetR/AcrR family transcriptional regulator n=1 Tax=Nocardia sp. NBC_00565 TaxID=2975993 RepID=UPI002E808BA7|nr:TetR/AcrR family transcriptional regulator [Nocardia sp. NBC_00565]WUC05813.1 TetR/AcrR family transcriptional regulator [Nocardia sp. NBC_00565]